MATKTLDLRDIIQPENLATQIAQNYTTWNSNRRGWLEEKKELRNYIFQTSTKDTANSSLPWKNSTVTPKICQIRDNLHANYMASLFPNEDWLTWIGADNASETEEKRRVIQAYSKNKAEASGLRATISKLVYDWIDYGNAFATTEYVNNVHKNDNQDEVVQYIGPKVVRISPFDIVFDPTASDFDNTPKIIRSFKSLGEIQSDLETRPELQYQKKAMDKLLKARQSVATMDTAEVDKGEGFQIDGFGSLNQYYSSGMVEFLEFYGDLFDMASQKVYRNHIITIVDRAYVIRNIPIPGWNVNKIRHVGWRLRPDNLYAMGPLDNLVGMQYRIDHLENLKADVFDLIAFPVVKIRGFVEPFNYGPNTKIIMGDDGDVAFERPDANALGADMMIRELEAKMEEFAGAPRQAMGIRTPGEKTAFEVQTLDNASGRIFQNKISYFEQMFLEPLLNDMLEVGRRSLSGQDLLRMMDNDIDVALFQTITAEDIKAKGILRPIGARHFATRNNMVQNLLGVLASPAISDQGVSNHISGLKLAQLIEEVLMLQKFGLVKKDVRILEQLESQRFINAAQEQLSVEQSQPAGVTADEMMPDGMMMSDGMMM